MPNYRNLPPAKKPELQQAEQAAAEALHNYFYRGLGVQARMARATGINPSALSKMGYGGPISLEQAMLIEVASNGELSAAMLCPSRAELIEKFLGIQVAKTST